MKKMSKNSIGAKSNRILIGAIAVVAILLFGVFTFFASRIMATETYYQLNLPQGQTLEAKQIITPDMVMEVATKEGTAPTNAISLADLQTGQVQAKYPLDNYEVLTYGNVGGGTIDTTVHDRLLIEKENQIADGTSPDEYKNWVITSFTVDSNSAVSGKINPGDYFDMLIISNEGSFYPFINMKSLDTSANPNSETTETGGQPGQYTVKMSPNDAARLQWLVSQYSNIKLLLNDKSDVTSEGEIIENTTTGDNRYEGFNPETQGPYNPYGTISPNLNVSDTPSSSENSTRQEALSNLAAEQAERMNEARAQEVTTDDTVNAESTDTIE